MVTFYYFLGSLTQLGWMAKFNVPLQKHGCLGTFEVGSRLFCSVLLLIKGLENNPLDLCNRACKNSKDI